MPLLILVLLAVLVANIGFWDTLQAVLGAVGFVILFFLVLAGLAAALASFLYAKVRRKL